MLYYILFKDEDTGDWVLWSTHTTYKEALSTANRIEDILGEEFLFILSLSI